MRSCNVKALLSASAVMTGCSSLAMARRHTEYWGSSVTGRTQPYAQGDMLPRLDNTRNGINESTGAAAALTGNPNGIAYSTENIFSVSGYSKLEQEHYQPLRGITKYVVEPITQSLGPDTAKMIESMQDDPIFDLNEGWWNPLFKDFPSLKKPFTKALCAEFETFYIAAVSVAHDDAAVTTLAKPFVEKQMTQNYISHPIFWRVAEKLSDAVEKAPSASRYHKLATRVAVERVTKLMLNTIADQPWANQDTTNPLYVDVSGFRAWNEAGYW